LRLSDPAYTERLALFLRSVGQTAVIIAPGAVELAAEADEGGARRAEVDIFLRVWNVLYPDADVELG
jgi:hypothetical protein